jgi:hypothetical protein
LRIDFHCHIFSGLKSIEALKKQFRDFIGYGFYERMVKKVQKIESNHLDDPIDKTIYHSKKAKINKIVLLPLSIKQNQEVKDWYNRVPDLFIPFYNPPEKSSRDTNVEDQILDALSNDVYKGLKIMISFRRKTLNDTLLYPALEVAEKLQMPVLFHTGYPPPGTKRQVLTYSNPINLEDTISSFPKLNIIIAHMGYPFVDIAMALAVQYPNVHVDISNLTYMMPNRLKNFLIRAKEMIGTKKILFGSDAFCQEMLEITIGYFNEVDFLTRNEVDQILGLNAVKLLKLE